MINCIENFFKTLLHKYWILYYTTKLCVKLLWRGFIHDFSKFYIDEFYGFSQNIKDLKKYQYGTQEYRDMLKNLRPILNLHYTRNRHHPQFHWNGFIDMSFLDRVEMGIDWLAASKRSKNGDIYKSIDINQGRFQYSNNDKKWIELLIEEIK